MKQRPTDMEEATGKDSAKANLVLTLKICEIRLEDFCDEISFDIDGISTRSGLFGIYRGSVAHMKA